MNNNNDGRVPANDTAQVPIVFRMREKVTVLRDP